MPVRRPPFPEAPDELTAIESELDRLTREGQTALDELTSAVSVSPGPLPTTLPFAPKARPVRLPPTTVTARPIPSPAEGKRLPPSPESVFITGMFGTDAGALAESIRLAREPTPASQLEATAARLNEARQRVVDLAEGTRRLEWRRMVLIALRDEVEQGSDDRGPVTGVADIFARYPLVNPNRDDVEFVARALNRTRLAVEAERHPDAPTLERRRALIQQLARRRSISYYGILFESGRDLLATLRELASPLLPEGMTEEDIRDLLNSLPLTDEDRVTQAAAIKDQARTFQEQWAQIAARYEILKSDFAQMELSDLQRQITGQRVREMLSAPALALLLPVEYWQKHVSRPLAAGALVSTEALRDLQTRLGLPQYRTPLANWLGLGEDAQEVDRLFQEARDQGEGSWRALAYGFENWDGNGFKKFLYEVAFDPITYFGIGVYPKILRPLPILSRAMAGAERAYLESVDLLFHEIQVGLFQVIPKTFSQIARQEAIASVQTMKAYLEAAFNFRPVRNIRPSEARDALTIAVTHLRQHPDSISRAADAARFLIRRPPLTEQEIAVIASRIGARLLPDPKTIHDGFLAQLDTFLTMTKGQGGRWLSREEMAEWMLRVFDAPADRFPDALMVLDDFERQLDTQVAQLLRPNSTRQMLLNLQRHLEETNQATRLSDIARARERWTRLSAWTTRVPAFMNLIHANSLDRFNRAAARWYLMFAFYSPMNIVENAFKTFFAGIWPFYKGNPTPKLLADTAGLTGLPELALFGDFMPLQLPPVMEMVKTSPQKLPRMSANTFRRLARENTGRWASWFGDQMEELLIRKGGRVGLRQAHHYLDQSFWNNLWRLEPKSMQQLRDTVAAAARNNLRGWRTEDLDALSREALHRMATGSKSRVLEMSTDFTPETFIAKDIQAMVSKHDLLGPIIQEYYQAALTDNTLWTKLMTDEIHVEASELVWQEVLKSPEIYRKNIKFLMEEFLQSALDSAESIRTTLNQVLNFHDQYTDFVGGLVEDVVRRTRSVVDPDLRVAAVEDAWDSILPLLTETAPSVRAALTRLRTAVPGLVEPDEAAKYVRLLDTQLEILEAELRAGQAQKVFQTDAFRRNVDPDVLGALGESEPDLIRRLRREHITGQAKDLEVSQWWQKYYQTMNSLWEARQLEVTASRDRLFAELAGLDPDPLPAAIDKSGSRLTAADIGYLYGVHASEITRSIFVPDLVSLMRRNNFVRQVFTRASRVASTAGRKADDIGFSRDAIGEAYDRILSSMRLDPAVQSLATPRFIQLENLRREMLSYAVRRKSVVPPDFQEQLQRFTTEISNNAPDAMTKDAWQVSRQEALKRTTDRFFLDFPNYDSGTAATMVGRAIYPFWSYETHRLWYLPRLWLRAPGTVATWGKYMDYSDEGYVPLAGPVQINFLRGSIWMGGLRRLLQRDYPDFYDRIPHLANVFDQASRFGFYPNITVGGIFALAGAKTGQIQVGELLPPPLQVPLEAFTATFPKSTPARAIQEILLPDRFRTYLVGIEVSRRGGDGPGLIAKKYLGREFTEEEQATWDKAQRTVSTWRLLDVNTGMLRLRPAELTEFRQRSKEAIAEILGIPVELQDQARRAGYRLEDFIPFPPEAAELLRDLEGAAQWRGLTTHLQESEHGRALLRVKLFWDEIAKSRDQFQIEQSGADNQWKAGLINLDQWLFKTREIGRKLPQVIDNLKCSEAWKIDANTCMPVTLEEREAFASAHKLDPLVLHPEEELVALYFSKELTEVWDEELGAIVPDWDSFFLHRRVVEQALPDPFRKTFTDRIRRWDTNMERFRRADWEQYVQPYVNAFDLVLSTFEPDQQRIIRRAKFTDSPIEREELRSTLLPGGLKLVANFETQLSQFRNNLRELDPEMDARLLVWGRVQSPRTEQALAIYQQLRKDYGFINP